MLPSVVQTADPAYEYWIYVVYDEGDAFYDSPTMLPKVVEWLQNAIERPLRERGVACQVVLLRYRNDIHKPGPVFNFVMRALYDDGADYLVRVNDDTELKNGPGRWGGRGAGGGRRHLIQRSAQDVDEGDGRHAERDEPPASWRDWPHVQRGRHLDPDARHGAPYAPGHL